MNDPGAFAGGFIAEVVRVLRNGCRRLEDAVSIRGGAKEFDRLNCDITLPLCGLLGGSLVGDAGGSRGAPTFDGLRMSSPPATS